MELSLVYATVFAVMAQESIDWNDVSCVVLRKDCGISIGSPRTGMLLVRTSMAMQDFGNDLHLLLTFCMSER
jgi:hypothetical protein